MLNSKLYDISVFSIVSSVFSVRLTSFTSGLFIARAATFDGRIKRSRLIRFYARSLIYSSAKREARDAEQTDC